MTRETFTLDWPFIKREAIVGLRSYFAPLGWPMVALRWAAKKVGQK